MNANRSLFPLLIICLSWVGLTVALHGFTAVVSVFGSTVTIFNCGIKILLILGMSSLTAVFIVYQETIFLEKTWLRCFLMAGAVLFSTLLYIYVRHAGTTTAVVSLLSSANLFVFAILAGTWISVPVTRIVELVPLCIVMSMADSYSVFIGPSQEISVSLSAFYQEGMHGVPPVADFLLIKFPLFGFSQPMPVFGVADWIITAFLASAAAKFDLQDNLVGKSLRSMADNGKLSFYVSPAVIGLVAALLLAVISGAFVPALPVVAVAFLSFIFIRYPQARKLTSAHWKAVILFALFFGVIGFIQAT